MKLKIYSLLVLGLLVGNAFSISLPHLTAKNNYANALESGDEKKIQEAGNELKKYTSTLEIINDTYVGHMPIKLVGEVHGSNVEQIQDAEIPPFSKRFFDLNYGLGDRYNKVIVHLVYSPSEVKEKILDIPKASKNYDNFCLVIKEDSFFNLESLKITQLEKPEDNC